MAEVSPVAWGWVSRDNSYEQGVVNSSLRKIAKGTGLALVGMIIATFLGFLTRVIIIHNISQAEYGVFILAITILSIATTVFLFGLPTGVTRFVAYHRGKGDVVRVKGTIVSALQITVVLGLVGAFLMFFGSGFIADLFNAPLLASALKILAVALPFSLVTGVLVASFQGFENIRPKVWFQDISINSLKIILIVFSILLSAKLVGLFWAYSGALIIIALSFILFSVYKLRAVSIKRITLRKEIIIFSFPLLFVGIANLILSWTDTLMIGYFKGSAAVGLYNGAVPLAHFIPIVLGASNMLYFPISSFLFSKKKFLELKNVYATITKWVVVLTLPLFLVLFLFPKIILNFFFGAEYIYAALALQILVFGFFFHTLLGPNGMSLISFGKQKLVSVSLMVAAVLNIFLNVLLIPLYGIVGAALATASSYIFVNVLYSLVLYKTTKTNPFTKNYLKPLLISMPIILLIYVIMRNILVISYWMLPFLFVTFLFIYGTVLLLTKSFDVEDINLLLAIEAKLKLNLGFVKKIIKRFI